MLVLYDFHSLFVIFSFLQICHSVSLITCLIFLTFHLNININLLFYVQIQISTSDISRFPNRNSQLPCLLLEIRIRSFSLDEDKLYSILDSCPILIQTRSIFFICLPSFQCTWFVFYILCESVVVVNQLRSSSASRQY